MAEAAEERKLVTVLFADIVGSTALGSQEDPERVRALLDSFFHVVAAEIDLVGGTVEKFAGDAVLASFGAPAAQEDHAERALHTALSVRRRVSELFGDRLSVRIGVNTGEVVVGPARVGGSFVTGDAVNVAARLEQAASPGEILVGERTVAAALGAFKFGEPAVVEAKGKPEGVACRQLVRAISLVRPRGIGGREAVFVGRASELRLLEATYQRAVEQGEPHLLTIMGDAGVGKTRLMREFCQSLAGEAPEPVRRTGRCLPYGQVAYWALGEILKEHLGILESDSPRRVRARLGGREILGLALGLEVSGDLHPLAAREQLYETWLDFLQELVVSQPAVVLVEDLHWAEEPLLDLLERTLREVRGPLLLVATARPELLDRRPAWGGGRRNASLVGLDALSPEESVTLVGELLADFHAGLALTIVERAEGNPFFIEELAASVLEQAPGAFSVPDSVQALIAARIDLLPPDEKAALQAASVIGRVFWPGPLRELTGGEPDWAMLTERDLVRRQPGSSMAGESEYAFKHALTREVAYAGLTKARRACLHAAFADWLEAFGEGRDEHAPLLAHHYAEAARPEDADLAWAGKQEELDRLSAKAVGWLARAAVLAVGRYEIDEGLELLRRALDRTSDEAERSAIWREIGRANALKFDGPAFWEAMQESLKTCREQATCGETYSLLAFHTATRSGMWKRRPEREAVDGWIEKALELTKPDSEAHARALIAKGYWHAREEGATARDASALAERLGDPELRSYAWMARAAAAFHEGHYEESFEWTQRRFKLVREITDPDHLTEMLEAAVPATTALGRFHEARRLAREHVERSRRLTPHHRMHGISLLIEVEETAGDWGAIRELTPAVEAAVEANAATPCIRNARGLLLCAVASAEAGELRRAAELEREADSLGMQAPPLIAPKARLALARTDYAELETALQQWESPISYGYGLGSLSARLDVLAVLRDRERVEAEAPRFLRPNTYLEPFALRALGIVRGDEALIEQAQERFEALRLDWHAAQTERLVEQA